MSCAHSKACLEAVVAHPGPYAEKGRWTEIQGKKTCTNPPCFFHLLSSSLYKERTNTRTDITGPADAEHGILHLYDIFSFRPQTLQGADILAHASPKPTLVVMVDWFAGASVDESWLATPSGRERLHEFLETTADPAATVPVALDILSELKTSVFPGVKRWGAVGFCWGGKVVSLLASRGAECPVDAAAQSSPARLEAEDAKGVTVPMAVLASEGEVGEGLEAYERELTGEKHVEVFGSQIHGWMTAR